MLSDERADSNPPGTLVFVLTLGLAAPFGFVAAKAAEGVAAPEPVPELCALGFRSSMGVARSELPSRELRDVNAHPASATAAPPALSATPEGPPREAATAVLPDAEVEVEPSSSGRTLSGMLAVSDSVRLTNISIALNA